MMGKRKTTGLLFDVGNVFDFQPRPNSFHGQLAASSRRLFQDESFQSFYHARRGRYSIPPSELALLLLLQAEAGCSDEETVERSACDLRWCAVLGKTAGRPLCAKSTYQEFRGLIVLNQQAEAVLKSSLEEAKRAGLLKGSTLRIAIDTKPIIGRGAVLDTYNLLGGGIEQLGRALAAARGQAAEVWAREHDFARYFGDRSSSLKGSTEIDWSDRTARNAFLLEIVVDARRALRLAEAFLSSRPNERGEAAAQREQRVRAPYELLGRLLAQDIAESTDAEGKTSAQVKEGTAPERIPSLTDPEQRHGRKSKSKRFTGHKLRIGVEVNTGLIGSVEVLEGSAGDAAATLAAVAQVESNTEMTVTETLGDCAYGGGETRQEFADAQRELLAKVPQAATNGEFYPKSAFQIDLAAGTVTCPAGHTTSKCAPDAHGHRSFQFGSRCATCPLRPQCTNAKQGRTLQVHAQEAALVAARAYQQTEAGRAKLRERVAVEHALARMAQRGVGQAKYCGKAKTHFQMVAAATVVNLRLVWNWLKSQGPPGKGRGAQPTTSTGPGGGASRSHAPGGDAERPGEAGRGQNRRRTCGLGWVAARILRIAGAAIHPRVARSSC